MSGARRGPNQEFTLTLSPLVAVTETIVLAIDCGRPHVFLGFQVTEDPEGNIIRTTGLSGKLIISIQTLSLSPIPEVPPNNVIDLSRPHTVDWAANTRNVICRPENVAGGNFYRIIATASIG